METAEILGVVLAGTTAVVAIFGLTALVGYFLTAKKHGMLQELGASRGLGARRGVLCLLPRLEGSYRGHQVTVQRITATPTLPGTYTITVHYRDPFLHPFTMYKRGPLNPSTPDPNTPFQDRLKVSRDPGGIAPALSTNVALVRDLLIYEADTNTRTFLITGKKVYWAVLEDDQPVDAIGAFLDRIVDTCETIESTVAGSTRS
jgi:hypothetical protein